MNRSYEGLAISSISYAYYATEIQFNLNVVATRTAFRTSSVSKLHVNHKTSMVHCGLKMQGGNSATETLISCDVS